MPTIAAPLLHALVTLVAAMVLAIAACDNAGDRNATPITGIRWELTMVDGESALPEPVAWIRFEDDGTTGGSTGCNSFGGTYEVDDDRISFADIAQTLIGCPGAVGEQESAFTAALSATVSYRVAEDTLTLLDDGGAERLIFTGG